MAHRNAQKDQVHQRSDLAGEYKYGDAGQLAIAFMFVLIWICDTFIFQYTTFLNQNIPNSIRLPLGIVSLSLFQHFWQARVLLLFSAKKERILA